MKNSLQKIALVAHACISFVFVLLTVLILFNFLPLNFLDGSLVVDSIVLVLVSILVICYVALTAYLLYTNFSQQQMLKYVELYRDSTATVMATSKTIKKLVASNAQLVGGIKIEKVRIGTDGKYGVVLIVWVQVSSEQVSYTLDTLRCLCEDTFLQVLGLRFSSIDFKVEKIEGSYQPSVQTAQQQAKTLQAERNFARDCYEDPLCDNCAEVVEQEGGLAPQKNQPNQQQETQHQDKDGDGAQDTASK